MKESGGVRTPVPSATRGNGTIGISFEPPMFFFFWQVIREILLMKKVRKNTSCSWWWTTGNEKNKKQKQKKTKKSRSYSKGNHNLEREEQLVKTPTMRPIKNTTLAKNIFLISYKFY